jgi:hypothetical protein
MAPEAQVLAEIDRELKAALSVSPPADFEARVLRRVEEDRAPARSLYGWLAAAAALVVATGLFYALTRNPASDAVAPPAIADRRPGIQLPQATPPHDPAAAFETRYVDRHFMPGPVRIARPEPEVIVPVNQMEAVRRLVRAANEGLVEVPPEPVQGPLAPPAELAVAPLVIEPIPVPSASPEKQAPSPDGRRLQ